MVLKRAIDHLCADACTKYKAFTDITDRKFALRTMKKTCGVCTIYANLRIMDKNGELSRFYQN